MACHWILKTEPETYSFQRLVADRQTNWNGVRNFQARNNLRKMTPGDLALIYHSGDEKALVGVARVVREAYADPDPEGGDWAQVDVQAVTPFGRAVTLKEIKSTPSLADLELLRQSRLSVVPISERHYKTLVKLGG